MFAFLCRLSAEQEFARNEKILHLHFEEKINKLILLKLNLPGLIVIKKSDLDLHFPTFHSTYSHVCLFYSSIPSVNYIPNYGLLFS